MKMDYEHYNEDKSMTQKDKAKKIAREIVGDGQSPNLWFVTYGPYISVPDEEGYDFELIEGRDSDTDTYTQGPFASYEDALKCYDEIELDFDYGIGQAFIEDRHCGVVTEKWLTKKVKTVYVYDECDHSKIFYKK